MEYVRTSLPEDIDDLYALSQDSWLKFPDIAPRDLQTYNSEQTKDVAPGIADFDHCGNEPKRNDQERPNYLENLNFQRL